METLPVCFCGALPVVQCNVELLQVGLVVSIAFLLLAKASLAFFQLGLHELFREPCVGHADDVTGPMKVMLN